MHLEEREIGKRKGEGLRVTSGWGCANLAVPGPEKEMKNDKKAGVGGEWIHEEDKEDAHLNSLFLSSSFSVSEDEDEDECTCFTGGWIIR
jgi:hypothetical protein